MWAFIDLKSNPDSLENWTFFLCKERNTNSIGLETHFSEVRLCYEQKKKKIKNAQLLLTMLKAPKIIFNNS